MKSLFILQLVCCVITAMLALQLAMASLQVRWKVWRYEISRWILVASMLFFSVHYLLQMIHGLRAQGTDVGAAFNILFIAIDNNFLPISEKEDFFTYLLHHQRNILLSLTPQEHIQLEKYFSLIWSILQEPPFRREAIRHLIASLLYNIEYIAKHYNQMKGERLTHQESIFQQFISLVNSYSKTERNVGFYADKLCLTPRYLNTLIRQTSQQTVMDWINQSIILEAKVLLKHSNLLVYQISDELNFPNPSFFCKFFKRMTGMTPQEYQKSE